jgi:hypothetical protein
VEQGSSEETTVALLRSYLAAAKPKDAQARAMLRAYLRLDAEHWQRELAVAVVVAVAAVAA